MAKECALTTNSYVLITDPQDPMFLRIGSVADIDWHKDGNVKSYTVIFSMPQYYDQPKPIIETFEYKADLIEKCKVLKLW